MEKAKELFALNGVTAVLTSNDMVAFGVLKQAAISAKSIPEELSIIGYDHLEIADILEVSLATVEQDSSSLTDQAVALLKNMLTMKKKKQKRLF